MIRKPSLFPLRAGMLSGAFLMAALSAALLGGCKGNTTTAAMLEHRPGRPPKVVAHEAVGDMRLADPLTSSAWQHAMLPLVPPANTLRTTAPTQGAVLFDEKALYVAFICEKPGNSSTQSRDTVSLYVDPLGAGKELFQVTIDASGSTRCAWLRSGEPAEPLEDGSPDFGHPVSAMPDMEVKGLWSQVREGTEAGTAVWMAQVELPVAGLPRPLQVKPAVGERWKFNLVRTYTTLHGSQVVDQTQANLSPFYVNAQAVSPYRMAELEFGGAGKLATKNANE
jgi:hypothetical protein